AGEFELVVSENLLAEVEHALAYPKLRKRVSRDEADAFIAIVRHGALLATDEPDVPRRSEDPGDDYLLALAEQERAVLVSCDQHLLGLADALPVQTAREFLNHLATR